MPLQKINGVDIYFELSGSGKNALIFVHGSWGDHNNWNRIIGELSKSFKVLVYDRRGHSQSERPPGQGSVNEDVSDLIALAENFELYPAHVIGSSFGAGIVLKTAVQREDIFKSMVIHEPPLFGLLKNVPEAQKTFQTINEKIQKVVDFINAGDEEKATEEFMENIGMGPGTWATLSASAKKLFIYNCQTWYDEVLDPESLQLNLATLNGFNKPSLLTNGSSSPPFYRLVIDMIGKSIPQATRITFEGAGHVPHMSHPEKYVQVIRDFCTRH